MLFIIFRYLPVNSTLTKPLISLLRNKQLQLPLDISGKSDTLSFMHMVLSTTDVSSFLRTTLLVLPLSNLTKSDQLC